MNPFESTLAKLALLAVLPALAGQSACAEPSQEKPKGPFEDIAAKPWTTAAVLDFFYPTSEKQCAQGLMRERIPAGECLSHVRAARPLCDQELLESNPGPVTTRQDAAQIGKTYMRCLMPPL